MLRVAASVQSFTSGSPVVLSAAKRFSDTSIKSQWSLYLWLDLAEGITRCGPRIKLTRASVASRELTYFVSNTSLISKRTFVACWYLSVADRNPMATAAMVAYGLPVRSKMSS